mmetsp:Transcript_1427/g.3825  ORF Transcript_1427/g.3825 Transcript_1427/m.3825 type:complete len:184 (-) Transcript_1427:219-770(-)
MIPSIWSFQRGESGGSSAPMRRNTSDDGLDSCGINQNTHLELEVEFCVIDLDAVLEEAGAGGEAEVDLNAFVEGEFADAEEEIDLDALFDDEQVLSTLAEEVDFGALVVGHHGKCTRPDAKPDMDVCAVCLDAPCDVVLRPCGHAQFCEACATKLMSCPLCRASIECHEGSRFTYIVCRWEWV